MDEGTFTGAGIDALPMPATAHVANDTAPVVKPRVTWRRLFGLGE